MDDFNSFFTSATPIGKHINTDEEDVVSRMHKLPTIGEWEGGENVFLFLLELSEVVF